MRIGCGRNAVNSVSPGEGLAHVMSGAGSAEHLAAETNMGITDILEASQKLSDVIDTILTRHDGPSPAVPHADWAYYRFGAVQVMVRDRSGGTTAAAIARGLLEEAGYWDWAFATGCTTGWLARLGGYRVPTFKGASRPIRLPLA